MEMESQEGQNWESIMCLCNKVDNIAATIDYNKKQIDGNLDNVLDMGDYVSKFESLDGRYLKKKEETIWNLF